MPVDQDHSGDVPPARSGGVAPSGRRGWGTGQRLAVAGGAAVILAGGAVVATRVLREPELPAAPAECVAAVARGISQARAAGYLPVHGTVGGARVDLDDGVTQSSGFVVEPGDPLTTQPLPPGPWTVWYPVAAAQLPQQGEHLLLLRPAERPRRDGGPLYEFSTSAAYPIRNGEVRVPCDGDPHRADLPALRAAVQRAG
ncbi:hypothetical protein [Micromonospora sp. NPDC049679]|uniref:hypothetical protein n=1 Tax=Micromonospora sp. NPDC049679 TaxID=3155920 RepID=UPI0033E638BF